MHYACFIVHGSRVMAKGPGQGPMSLEPWAMNHDASIKQASTIQKRNEIANAWIIYAQSVWSYKDVMAWMCLVKIMILKMRDPFGSLWSCQNPRTYHMERKKFVSFRTLVGQIVCPYPALILLFSMSECPIVLHSFCRGLLAAIASCMLSVKNYPGAPVAVDIATPTET